MAVEIFPLGLMDKQLDKKHGTFFLSFVYDHYSEAFACKENQKTCKGNGEIHGTDRDGKIS